jgi:hypothetical protein
MDPSEGEPMQRSTHHISWEFIVSAAHDLERSIQSDEPLRRREPLRLAALVLAFHEQTIRGFDAEAHRASTFSRRAVRQMLATRRAEKKAAPRDRP